MYSSNMPQTFYSKERLIQVFPSVCCEYMLLQLVNEEPALGLWQH